jgi:transglutaminase/protease-like cytokinesis protein 3
MKMRKIPLITAALVTISMFAACSAGEETVTTMSELVPNVITQAEGETITTPPITDAEGNTYPSMETKSPEQLQSELDAMMTAVPSQTTATNIVTQSPDTIKTADRYAYNTLTDFEKSLYDAMVRQISSLQINVPNALGNVDVETWNKVYGMVYNQEPQLFWMSPRITSAANIGKLYYRTRDPEAIKKMQSEIDVTVNKIMSDISGMSTFEKLDYINTYLALNSTFLEVQETEDQALFNGTIYNAFAGGTAKQGDLQCSGYAHAVQYLCDLSGIECMYITGTNKAGQSHAWNVVKVDGNWYNFDTTWADPILDKPNLKNVNHMYFLVPDSWIIDKSHYNHNMITYADGTKQLYFTPPACTSDTMNWFKQKGEVYSDAASAKTEIKAQLDNAAKNGLRTTEIMCSSKAVYDAVKADAMTMQNDLKSKYSTVKGLSDKSNEYMLVIELDVIYN